MSDTLNRSIRQAVRRPEVVEALCVALEEQLRQSLGGSELYVSKRPDRNQRDEAIRTGFRGDNLEELANRHKLTTRQVRRILQLKVLGK
jgi:Mor family transcriptional regulator